MNDIECQIVPHARGDMRKLMSAGTELELPASVTSCTLLLEFQGNRHRMATPGKSQSPGVRLDQSEPQGLPSLGMDRSKG